MSTKHTASQLLHLFRKLAVDSASRCVSSRQLNTRAQALDPERIQWVFLGPPGVGKGTYSTRVAVALGVAHIAAGDLVRGEIRQRTPLGQKVRSAPFLLAARLSHVNVFEIPYSAQHG